MIYKRFEDIKVGDVYLFTGRDYFLEGKKVRVVERGEYADEDELTVVSVDGYDNSGLNDRRDDLYYVKQSDLTELEQPDDQWEWGIARGSDELVDPHRTGMTEEQAREWVAEFEGEDGGRKGAFIVIKRPVSKWEVA